jgi:hypothetical protein
MRQCRSQNSTKYERLLQKKNPARCRVFFVSIAFSYAIFEMEEVLINSLLVRSVRTLRPSTLR